MINQILVIIGNIVLSALSGYIGYHFNRKIDLYKNNREILEQTLTQVLIPLTSILDRTNRKPTIESILTVMPLVADITKANSLLVPDAHKDKIYYLLELIEKYNAAYDVEMKKNYETQVLKKYLTLRSLIFIYYDEVKRNLGYPYYSLFQQIKYSSTSPYYTFFNAAAFTLIFVLIYIVLLLINVYWALIFMIAVAMIMFLVGLVHMKIDRTGGWKVFFHGLLQKVHVRKKR